MSIGYYVLGSLAILGWLVAFGFLEYATKLRLKLKSMGIETKNWEKW